MRLVGVKITNFKSVLDSDWFAIDDLTCLVGKNEAGKTALIEALEKLNSVVDERSILRDTEYPRMNWSEYEESDEVDTAVSTRWEFDTDELAYVAEVAGGTGVLTSPVVTVTKNYDNTLQWKLSLDLASAVKAAVDFSGLEKEEKNALAMVRTTVDLLKRLKDTEERSPRQEAFYTELTERWPQGGLQATLTAWLRGRLPRFVYYSQYDRLPGRISLNMLVQAKQNGTLEQIPGSQVFIALLSMVGTTPEGINQINTSEQLISKLEAVQTRLSRKIFKYWSQNKHLKVRFRFDEASPGDPTPYNSGKVFQTRIENTRHEATIRLDERSTGFIWFFSFLVWFSEVQRQHGDNLIVLLDEPGLSLHARAQSDLLNFIKEDLLPKYQVIYTTHSPFMIDPADLLSCRTVEDVNGKDGEVLGTKVGDQVLSTDNDTVFPLQAALGYDLTQTLFIGKDCLLVEGPSDLLYLQWASDQLRKQGRTSLDQRWTITPCGGITKISSFMALFSGSRLHVSVLTDFGHGDKKKVRDLRESNLLQDGHVFSADMYCDGASEADVEDILGRTFYIELVKSCYGLTTKQALPKTKPQRSPERVVAETESHFRSLPASVPEFDHYTPSRYLLEHSAELTLTGTGAALDRFEKLFGDLNQLL